MNELTNVCQKDNVILHQLPHEERKLCDQVIQAVIEYEAQPGDTVDIDEKIYLLEWLFAIKDGRNVEPLLKEEMHDLFVAVMYLWEDDSHVLDIIKWLMTLPYETE